MPVENGHSLFLLCGIHWLGVVGDFLHIQNRSVIKVMYSYIQHILYLYL